MIRPLHLLLVCLPGLAACQSEAPVDPACRADGYATLIGQPVAAADAIPDPKRIVRPNQMVTMDYIETRINVALDGNDVIIALTCG